MNTALHSLWRSVKNHRNFPAGKFYMMKRHITAIQCWNNIPRDFLHPHSHTGFLQRGIIHMSGSGRLIMQSRSTKQNRICTCAQNIQRIPVRSTAFLCQIIFACDKGSLSSVRKCNPAINRGNKRAIQIRAVLRMHRKFQGCGIYGT